MLLFIHIIIPLIVSQKQEEKKIMKHIRDDIKLDAYDLIKIWRLAYRLGYIDGYESCEDEGPCSPRNDSIPEFIGKLLEKEDTK